MLKLNKAPYAPADELVSYLATFALHLTFVRALALEHELHLREFGKRPSQEVKAGEADLKERHERMKHGGSLGRDMRELHALQQIEDGDAPKWRTLGVTERRD